MAQPSTAVGNMVEIANLSIYAAKLYIHLIHMEDGSVTKTQLKAVCKAKSLADIDAAFDELREAGLLDRRTNTIHFRGIALVSITDLGASRCDDAQIRNSLVIRMQEADAMPGDGDLRQTASNAQARRRAQREILREAWKYLFPEDADFPFAEANRCLHDLEEQGEEVLDYMFTIHDAPREKELRSPRAALLGSLHRLVNPEEYVQQPQAPQTPQRPKKASQRPQKAQDVPQPPQQARQVETREDWLDGLDAEEAAYARRLRENNPGMPVAEVAAYAKRSVRAKRHRRDD